MFGSTRTVDHDIGSHVSDRGPAGAAGFESRGRTAASKERLEQVRTRNLVTIGWGGRIRTCECRYQKPVPYHLATLSRPPSAAPRTNVWSILIFENRARAR